METEESIATVINTARKNADQLCRNRWNSSTLADVLCYDLSSNLVIPDFNFTNRKGKTVIVKNGDVVITQAMSKNEAPINLFIDRGNLYLKNPESTGNLQDFDAYGFPTDGAIVGGAKANYLKGNFIINGLIMGTNDDY